MKIVKTIFSIILLIGIVLLGIIEYQLYFNEKYQIKSLKQNEEITAFTKYNINKTQYWPNRYSYKKSEIQKKLPYSCRDNKLKVNDKYIIQYQCSDMDALIQVSQYFNHKLSSLKHLIFKYHHYVQVYSVSQTQQLQGQFCTQLQVDQNDNYVYFTDMKNDLWIISYPNNNLLFVQIYNCVNKQLLKRIFHQPKCQDQSLMINQIFQISYSINNKGNQWVQIIGSTYNMGKYELRINAHNFQVVNEKLVKSHEIIKQTVLLKNQEKSFDQKISYYFIDPQNYLSNVEFKKIVDDLSIWFMQKVKNLMKTLNFDVSWLIKLMKKQKIRDQILDYKDFNMEVINPIDNCLVALNINQSSFFASVQPYMTNTRTPLFHNIKNLSKYDIISVLKRSIIAPTSQFKRLDVGKNFFTQITTERFQTVHKLQPDSSVQYIGIGEKLLFFYPLQNLKEQEYYHIRSQVGGVILQGNKIKGAYQDRPRIHPQHQVEQIFSQNANEVLKGIFQVHVGYKHLYTDLKNNRIQLVNGLNGKTIFTHYFNIKENYNYSSTFLQNNEWWIVEYNNEDKLSYAVKYQLFVDREKIKQIMGVKRTYGKIQNSQFQEGEDHLALILNKFNQKYKKGFLIINIFKCIDEFYYIQYTDSQGENYGLSRIHFKKLSNRYPKRSNQYSGQLEKDLQVEPKDMIKQKQRMEPFGVVLEKVNLFKTLMNQKNRKKQIKTPILYQHQSDSSCYIHSNLQKIQSLSVVPYSITLHSHYAQKCTQSFQNASPLSQYISVVDMRGLIIHLKNKQIQSFKAKAKTFLLASTLILLIILCCLLIKLTLKSEKLPIVDEEKKASQNSKNLNENSPKKVKKDEQKKHK